MWDCPIFWAIYVCLKKDPLYWLGNTKTTWLPSADVSKAIQLYKLDYLDVRVKRRSSIDLSTHKELHTPHNSNDGQKQLEKICYDGIQWQKHIQVSILDCILNLEQIPMHPSQFG